MKLQWMRQNLIASTADHALRTGAQSEYILLRRNGETGRPNESLLTSLHYLCLYRVMKGYTRFMRSLTRKQHKCQWRAYSREAVSKCGENTGKPRGCPRDQSRSRNCRSTNFRDNTTTASQSKVHHQLVSPTQ